MADKFTDNQLFNLIGGSSITGESTFDIWRSLGYEGDSSDFIDFMKSQQNNVIDNLESTDTTKGLSANQGRVLNENKVSLPVDENGEVDKGTAGLFAVSDGKGGITWVSLDGNEVEY